MAVTIEDKFIGMEVSQKKNANNAVQIVLPSSTGLDEINIVTNDLVIQSVNHTLAIVIPHIHLTCL